LEETKTFGRDPAAFPVLERADLARRTFGALLDIAEVS